MRPQLAHAASSLPLQPAVRFSVKHQGLMVRQRQRRKHPLVTNPPRDFFPTPELPRLTAEKVSGDNVPVKVLVIDVGGTHVKLLATGRRTRVEIPSDPALTAARMVRAVRKATKGWVYDAVSIGYPGPVVHNQPIAEPCNLGRGWVGFDFRKAFRRPVRLINDAAMQALGSYEGGRMLFLGLGTGLGSAMIVDGILEPMELAHLPYRNGKTFEQRVGAAALKRVGRKKWQREVDDVLKRLLAALEPDYVMLGGGNAGKIDRLPRKV